MRLAFHYHTPAVIKNGEIYMPAYLGLFIDSLAPHFDHITCFQHEPGSKAESEMMDYRIKAAAVTLRSLGPHGSIPSRLLRSREIGKVFLKYQGDCDFMLLRASTPMLTVIKRVWKRPLALMLVSDATLGLDNLPQPAWRKFLIKKWAAWYASQERVMAIKSLTIVNSQMLFDDLKEDVKQLHLIRTTTLSEGDFFSRKDTCQSEQKRLIYAGRITRIKGLLDILEAMSILVKEGIDLRFDLVGMADPSDSILEEMKERANLLGLESRWAYLGYRTAGGALLEEYRKSDVFVIGSQASSEGFPRTLWEAMASSLPIVATAVSSIPMFTKGVAELVPPRDVGAYADALRNVLTDPKRRQDMIRGGLALAKENTLEERGKELSDLLKEKIKVAAS